MRVSFIWDWPIDPLQSVTWKDGLAAAIRELSKRHEVRVFAENIFPTIIPHEYFNIYCYPQGEEMKKAVGDWEPEVILMWGDATRPNAEPISKLAKPMALCFAGGDVNGHTMQYFKHFFVESRVYQERFELYGQSVSRAFGTNTGLFKPVYGSQKVFDVIFPATYASWKRHDLFADAVSGYKGICAGFMYTDHERDCYEYPQSKGILCLPHVSAETLRHLYAASRICLITSHSGGGSQITCLEAMAMNLPVIGMSDSDKISEYLREGGGIICEPRAPEIHDRIRDLLSTFEETKTRGWVVDNYSEFTYAKALEDGLAKLI